VILLFPDGTLSSVFWRGTLRAYGALYAALLAALGGTRCCSRCRPLLSASSATRC
jgi:hypothetical protein